jgi:DNA-binding MarR family transcriptional regulator
VTDSETLAGDLRIALMRLTRRLRAERGPAELSYTQATVLGVLERCGPMTAGALASSEGVQPPSMTRVIAFLEESGLVSRAADPVDRRQVRVTLTEVGRQTVLETRALREAWLARRLEQLTTEERDILRAATTLVQRLAQK